jgi:hypothetical protein
VADLVVESGLMTRTEVTEQLSPARPHPGADRIGCLWHAAMGVAMIAMCWPPGAAIPAMIWTVAFTVASVRFAALARRRSRPGPHPVPGTTTAPPARSPPVPRATPSGCSASPQRWSCCASRLG